MPIWDPVFAALSAGLLFLLEFASQSHSSTEFLIECTFNCYQELLNSFHPLEIWCCLFLSVLHNSWRPLDIWWFICAVVSALETCSYLPIKLYKTLFVTLCILSWEMTWWSKGILLHKIEYVAVPSSSCTSVLCCLWEVVLYFCFSLRIYQAFFLIFLDNWSVLARSLPVLLIIKSTQPNRSMLQYVLPKLFQEQQAKK